MILRLTTPKSLILSLLTALSAATLVSCGGARTFAPALNETNSGAARSLRPQALQRDNGAQFAEYGTSCVEPLGPLSHGTTSANMWFTVPQACKKNPPEVDSVAISTGVVTAYKLPKGSAPEAIVESSGYVWVADTHLNKNGTRLMYRFKEDGSSSSFPLPGAIDVSDMAAGSDGNVWFVGSYLQGKQTSAGVGYITPTGKATLYNVSGSATPQLTSIAAGSDGDLWLTDEENGTIVAVAPKNGAITKYVVKGHPLYITNSSNSLVYSDETAAQLSVITTKGAVKVYPAPHSQQPAFLARKNDGTVMYIDTAEGSDYIGTFDPTTGTYEAEAQAPNAGLRYLYNGPDGNMWFTDEYGDVGAYLQFILTSAPASLSIGPALCTGTFTLSEAKFSGTFSVASLDTGVATVSPKSGSGSTTFTVTEVTPGSTSISAQDAMQNVIDIPVSILGNGCGSDSQTFTYTGAPQSFTVPAGVTQVTVQAYGGSGAGGSGDGGFVQATIPVTPSEVLAVFVGGNGSPGTVHGGGAGGYNGGASGGGDSRLYDGDGGGGASDVRQGGSALGNRVVVAGGGGGSGYGFAGGAGGGLVGAPGAGASYPSSPYGGGGGGGTQSQGGAAGSGSANSYCFGGSPGSAGALADGGQGGDGGEFAYPSCGGPGGSGGGGGSGYYGGGGGGGGAPDADPGGGGGGGSSFTEPSATSVINVQGGSNAGQITISWGPSNVRRRH